AGRAPRAPSPPARGDVCGSGQGPRTRRLGDTRRYRLHGSGLLDRRGSSDVEALGEVDSVVADQVEGHLVLDTLGDRLDPEALRDSDDRPHDLLIGRVVAKLADEVHVDLYELDRKVLQVGEASVPGTEVVERKCTSET